MSATYKPPLGLTSRAVLLASPEAMSAGAWALLRNLRVWRKNQRPLLIIYCPVGDRLMVAQEDSPRANDAGPDNTLGTYSTARAGHAGATDAVQLIEDMTSFFSEPRFAPRPASGCSSLDKPPGNIDARFLDHNRRPVWHK